MWQYDRVDVPQGEGYLMSDRCIKRFCEPCLERLIELEILKTEDYTKTQGECLFDFVTTEMIEVKTEKQNDKGRNLPLFASGNHWSWQRLHKKVNADEAAIVVANALIQEGCQTHHLELDGIHYNDPGLGNRGYKALAFALAINKTHQCIEFFSGLG